MSYWSSSAFFNEAQESRRKVLIDPLRAARLRFKSALFSFVSKNKLTVTGNKPFLEDFWLAEENRSLINTLHYCRLPCEERRTLREIERSYERLLAKEKLSSPQAELMQKHLVHAVEALEFFKDCLDEINELGRLRDLAYESPAAISKYLNYWRPIESRLVTLNNRAASLKLQSPYGFDELLKLVLEATEELEVQEMLLPLLVTTPAPAENRTVKIFIPYGSFSTSYHLKTQVKCGKRNQTKG